LLFVSKKTKKKNENLKDFNQDSSTLCIPFYRSFWVIINKAVVTWFFVYTYVRID